MTFSQMPGVIIKMKRGNFIGITALVMIHESVHRALALIVCICRDKSIQPFSRYLLLSGRLREKLKRLNAVNA